MEQETVPESRRPVPKPEGLTVDEPELERLAKQPCLSQPWITKLETEARKNWDKFYNRNSDKFFKDRHWGKEEIGQVCKHLDFTKPLNYLEAGCGVGNMLFPMAEWFPHWRLFGFDFSKNAVTILKRRAEEINLPVSANVVDLLDVPENLFDGAKMDLATLIFVISAITPEKHVQALSNLSHMMAVGGTVVFRDYAAYDHAMMRFAKENKISDRFYKRADWTRAYYFHKDEVENMFSEAGFETVECLYYHSITENRQSGVKVNRVFLQGVFVKKNGK